MSTQAIVPVGSRWFANLNPTRVFVVTERLPFGRIRFQEEGRAYFGESWQKQFLLNFTRMADAP